MSAREATTVYIETTIPPGMTMSAYRRSRVEQHGPTLGRWQGLSRFAAIARATLRA
jgi:hypothetical protein